MTQFIEWSDELSTGIGEIDNQHQVLVNLLNQIHEAIQHRHGAEVTNEILGRLSEYTRIHFAVEESLMQIFQYPDYQRHKEEHDRLIEQLNLLQAKPDAGKASISFELAHFLKVWLTKHIMGSDKHYGPYFLERGIRGAEPTPKSRAQKLWQWLGHDG